MKKLSLTLMLLLLLTGCIARVGPRGGFIEPLFPLIALLPPLLLGPPVVVAPPPDFEAQPLPPVAIAPDRDVYFYNNLYYYHWNNGWYWGRDPRGPWHVLPRDRWPSRMEPLEKWQEHGGGATQEPGWDQK